MPAKDFEDARNLRKAEDWHEEDGAVLWWNLPISEPPTIGSPLDLGFEVDHYTHWTPIVVPTISDELDALLDVPFLFWTCPTCEVAGIPQQVKWTHPEKNSAEKRPFATCQNCFRNSKKCPSTQSQTA